MHDFKPRGLIAELYASEGFSLIERRCRGVVRLEFLPKAAYLEGRCRLLLFMFIGGPSITPCILL